MPLTLPFDGGFSTGNASQYDGTGTNFGSVAVVSSYPGITLPGGSSGGYMGHTTLNAGGSTRGEWNKLYEYADFHTQTKYITSAFCLDPAQDWSTITGHIVLGQNLYRELQSYSFALVLTPIGWQGLGALSVKVDCRGGFTTPGATPSSEHYMILDETASTGWNTLVTPGTYRAAERGPQAMGPNVFQTGGNIPVTEGDWHQWIAAVTSYTNVALGKVTVYYRKKGTGPTWTTVVDTTATWKTVQYNTSLSQPVASSGSNNLFTTGAYASSGVPSTFHLFFGNFSIQNSLAAAQAVFAPEVGGGSGGQASYTVTTGGAVGL